MPRSPASPAPTSEIVVYENGGDLRSRIRKASRRASRSARPASSDCSRLRRSGTVGLVSSQDLRRRISMQNMHNNVQNLHIIPSFSAEQSAVVAKFATVHPTMPTVQGIWTVRLQGTLSLSSGRAATPRESTDARASRTRVSRGMLALAKSRVQQLAPPAPKPKPKIGFAQARR